MKKFLVVFAAVAVVGTAGYAIAKNEKNKTDAEPGKETTTFSQNNPGDNFSDNSGDTPTEKNIDNKPDKSSNSDTKTEPTSAPSKIDEKESSFTATINSYSERMMMVTPDKDAEETKSASKFSVNISNVKLVDENGKEIKSDDVKNFAKAKITYKGGVQETYPAGITATKVVLTGRVNCNVYFSVRGEVVRTLTVGMGSSLEESDMPNAGAYCEDGYHFDGWCVDSKKIDGLTNITDSVTVVAKISKD